MLSGVSSLILSAAYPAGNKIRFSIPALNNLSAAYPAGNRVVRNPNYRRRLSAAYPAGNLP